MKVGFTGTRHALTEPQQDELGNQIAMAFDHMTEFHHGACVGADAVAVAFLDKARRDLREHRKIVAHPGDWAPLASMESMKVSDEVRACRPMLERNKCPICRVGNQWDSLPKHWRSTGRSY